MKRFVVFIVMISFMILVLSMGIIRISSATDIKVRTGFTFDWWKSNADTGLEAIEGSQFYIPIRIGTQHKEFSFDILIGYINTNVDLSDGGSKSLSSILDTKVNCAYEISGKLPLDVLLGLDLNLPTGRTDLTTDDLFLVVDPELVSITKFGEGFNLNPTLSLAGEWGDWTAGIGLGYDWRGEYDYSSQIQDYDPGDIINFITESSYDFCLNWQGRFFTEFARFTKDKIGDEDWYQEGNFLLLGLGLNYYQAQWDTDFTLRSIIRGKSKWIQEGAVSIISTEDKNSHGDEWIADFALRYSLNDRIRFNSSFEFLWADENDYPSDSPIFIGKKQKLSLGVGTIALFASYLEGELKIKGFYLNGEDRDYRGISIIARLTTNF